MLNPNRVTSSKVLPALKPTKGTPSAGSATPTPLTPTKSSKSNVRPAESISPSGSKGDVGSTMLFGERRDIAYQSTNGKLGNLVQSDIQLVESATNISNISQVADMVRLNNEIDASVVSEVLGSSIASWSEGPGSTQNEMSILMESTGDLQAVSCLHQSLNMDDIGENETKPSTSIQDDKSTVSPELQANTEALQVQQLQQQLNESQQQVRLNSELHHAAQAALQTQLNEMKSKSVDDSERLKQLMQQFEFNEKESKTRVEALEAEISASRSEVSRLSNVVESLQNEVNGTKTELLASLQHSSEISQKLTQSNAELLKCKDDSLMVSNCLEIQLKANQSLLEHMNFIESSALDLEKQIQVVQDTMVGLKSATESKISKLVAETQRATKMIEIVGGKAEMAQNEIASSETVAVAIRAELDAARRDRQALFNDVREYLLLNQSLAQERQLLSQRVESFVVLGAQQSPASVDSSKHEVVSLDVSLVGDLTGTRLAELLRHQNEGMARDVESMRAMVTRLESQRQVEVTQMRALHSQTDEHLELAKDLENKNQMLSTAVAEMAAQLKAEAEARGQLAGEVQTLRGQASAQVDDLLELHAQLRGLQQSTEAESAARQQRIDGLAEECQRGLEQAERLTQALESAEATILELINGKEGLNAQLGESRARVTEMEAQFAAERGELEGQVEQLGGECVQKREERDALQQRCEALTEEIQVLKAQVAREIASKEQLAQLVEQLTHHAKGAEEARLELAGRHDELVAIAQRDAEERVGLTKRLEEEAALRQKWEAEAQALAKRVDEEASAAALDAAERRRLGQQVEDLLLRNQAELEANAQLGLRAEEAAQQCAREAEERRRLAEAVDLLNGVVEQLQAQALGDAEAHKVLQAEKRALQLQVEELGKRHSTERAALHGRLQDANARLALAAEALHGAARKSGDMAVLEQQLAEATRARDEARTRATRAEAAAQQARTSAAALEGQLAQVQQEAGGAALELERARERVQSYERALFDTRQSIALKDARVAELEASVSRLSNLLSARPSTGRRDADPLAPPPPLSRFSAPAAEDGGSDPRVREYGSAPRSSSGRAEVAVSFDLPAVRVPPIHYESQFL